MLYYSQFRPGRGDGDGLQADIICMWGDFMSKGQKAAPRSTWGNERKENQKKWQRENRTKLSADVSKETAALFRSLCADNNTAVSAALSAFVRAAIHAGTLDIIRDDLDLLCGDSDGRRDGDDFTRDGRAAGNGRRDDPPGQNDTPGTVDIPENASD